MIKLVFSLLLLLNVASAQILMQKTRAPFHWTASFLKDTLSNRPEAFVRVKLAIDENYYVYASKTFVRFESTPAGNFAAPVYSPSVKHADLMTQKNENVFLDSLIVRIALAQTAPSGDSIKITLLCAYQGCTTAMCFLPKTDTVFIAVAQKDLPAMALIPGQTTALNHDGPTQAGASGNRTGIVALLFAFLGGLLTCLTPCVYPLIPVTLSVFGATAAKSKLRAFLLSCTYVAGICVMFSTLGFVVASSGKVFGQFLANPLVAIAIAAVFCLFGISLLGAFDLQLPSAIQNRLATVGGKKSGFQKVFFMGLVAGIIAAPCTGPSLGAILTYVATAGNQLFGILMLLFFSLGLGLPFVLLGTFSSLVVSRPKPGPWMEGVKSFLGIVMFVMALYYVRTIVPWIPACFGSTPLYYIILALGIILGVALGAIHLSYHGASKTIIAKKTVGIILVIGGSFGIIGSILFGPSMRTSENTSLERGLSVPWIHGIDAGLSMAKSLNKPAIIDFYADWCIACKELDKNTFSNALVRKELGRFVCIRQDLTRETEQTKQIAQRFALRGIPVLEIYSSSGERLLDKRIVGFVSAQQLLDLLKKIP